ncbi:hypothetical protein ACFC1R_38725 [Kitasatospora sp. NPDC056138]|uniref:hypothetical protein n=1 Tax=Kitasatospora sp. NPDC056138 TaxID=3345724 RepID=UPI0035D71229
MTAFFSFGQPTTLWSGGAPDARLATRAMVKQLQDLVTKFSLDEGSAPGNWLSNRDRHDRAVYDLSAGRSYAVTFTHGDVTYVLMAAVREGVEPRRLVVSTF